MVTVGGLERGISAWESILGKRVLQWVSVREEIKTSGQDLRGAIFSFGAFILRLDWFLPLAWAADDPNRFKGNVKVLVKVYE